MLLQFRRRDRRRLQASFRRGTSYPFWRLGFRQSSFRHITRIFPARRPVRLGTAAGFLACYCPLHLSDLGSAIRSRDISSHLCPLCGRYSTAPRGADRVGCAARSRPVWCGPFPRSLPPNPVGTFQCAGLSSDEEDFQYRPGVLHYAYLTVPYRPVTCAPSPCGPALPYLRLAGRYSCDYYGHSVAIGLASRKAIPRSSVLYVRACLGVPFASFNALTGHRSCVPEDYGMLLQFRRRDRRRLQASFRRGTSYPFWRLGFRQSSFRHITRIFPARRPVRLGTAAGFLACYCPLHLSDLGSAIRSRDISSHLCPLCGRYSTAPRGAAAAKCSNRTDLDRPL